MEIIDIMEGERLRPLSETRPPHSKNPSKRDPVFDSKEEATQFLESCAIVKTTKEPNQPMNNECICGRCLSIIVLLETKNSIYQHLCCRQLQSWNDKFSYDANIQCVTETTEFLAVTNDFAVKNLLLHSWKTSKQKNLNDDHQISNPPTNSNMRYGNYRAISLLLEGRGERKPLPACTMLKIRDNFPDNFDVYTGYRFK